MAEPENIIQFRAMTARVLGKLYANHPAPLDWNAADFFDGEGPSDDEFDLFDHTLRYLIDNWYVTEVQLGLQLSARSWDVLQKPDPVAPTKSLGTALVDLLRTGSAEAAKVTVGHVTNVALSKIGVALGIIL